MGFWRFQRDVIIVILLVWIYIFSLTWPDLKKIVLSLRIGNFNIHNNWRTRIPRWLGRTNEENVVQTRNCCGCPSSPHSIESFIILFKSLKKIIFCLESVFLILDPGLEDTGLKYKYRRFFSFFSKLTGFYF